MSTNRFPLGNEFRNAYLTKRELEVLKCVLHGLSAKQAGQNMGISNRTVEKYVELLKIKLKCKRTAEMVAVCIKQQWVANIY
jgi:DNA-binding CsgD family transcriptional regulator